MCWNDSFYQVTNWIIKIKDSACYRINASIASFHNWTNANRCVKYIFIRFLILFSPIMCLYMKISIYTQNKRKKTRKSLHSINNSRNKKCFNFKTMVKKGFVWYTMHTQMASSLISQAISSIFRLSLTFWLAHSVPPLRNAENFQW